MKKLEESLQLIRNSLQTPDGTILHSHHRHDYVTHSDANGKEYMVDGGLDYARRSMNGDEIDLNLWDDEPHSVQREVLRWGTYGINGDEAKKYVMIKDMDVGHMKLVLIECNPVAVIRRCLQEELRQRDKETT